MTQKKTKRKKRKPSWFGPADFEVRPSTVPGIGLGLFARTRLRKGDVIGHYTGRRLTEEEANSEPYVNSRYLVWICKDWYLDAQGNEGNYTKYINHSPEPNAELLTNTRWKVALIQAMTRIEPREEIFFDYGDEYWEVLGEDIKK